jgi:hypothetical protein
MQGISRNIERLPKMPKMPKIIAAIREGPGAGPIQFAEIPGPAAVAGESSRNKRRVQKLQEMQKFSRPAAAAAGMHISPPQKRIGLASAPTGDTGNSREVPAAGLALRLANLGGPASCINSPVT